MRANAPFPLSLNTPFEQFIIGASLSFMLGAGMYIGKDLDLSQRSDVTFFSECHLCASVITTIVFALTPFDNLNRGAAFMTGVTTALLECPENTPNAELIVIGSSIGSSALALAVDSIAQSYIESFGSTPQTHFEQSIARVSYDLLRWIVIACASIQITSKLSRLAHNSQRRVRPPAVD